MKKFYKNPWTYAIVVGALLWGTSYYQIHQVINKWSEGLHEETQFVSEVIENFQKSAEDLGKLRLSLSEDIEKTRQDYRSLDEPNLFGVELGIKKGSHIWGTIKDAIEDYLGREIDDQGLPDGRSSYWGKYIHERIQDLKMNFPSQPPEFQDNLWDLDVVQPGEVIRVDFSELEKYADEEHDMAVAA